MTMTQDKAQKTAARQRMAQTGEPYSVARRETEREHAASATTDPDSGAAATPRDDNWYASVAAAAGISVGMFKAQEQAANASRLLDQARIRADQAQERADSEQERAEQLEEAASMLQEAADLAREAAGLTEGRTSDQEQDRARQRADQAQVGADQAQQRADQAQRQADKAQERAGQAEDVANEAESAACHADSLAADFSDDDADDHDADDEDADGEDADGEDGPDWTRGNLNRDRANSAHAGHRGGQHDPLQDRVDRIWQRFGQVRERADVLMSRAERILGLTQEEPEHTDSA
jgi:chromosome segregation ATPase